MRVVLLTLISVAIALPVSAVTDPDEVLQEKAIAQYNAIKSSYERDSFKASARVLDPSVIALNQYVTFSFYQNLAVALNNPYNQALYRSGQRLANRIWEGGDQLPHLSNHLHAYRPLLRVDEVRLQKDPFKISVQMPKKFDLLDPKTKEKFASLRLIYSTEKPGWYKVQFFLPSAYHTRKYIEGALSVIKDFAGYARKLFFVFQPSFHIYHNPKVAIQFKGIYFDVLMKMETQIISAYDQGFLLQKPSMKFQVGGHVVFAGIRFIYPRYVNSYNAGDHVDLGDYVWQATQYPRRYCLAWQVQKPSMGKPKLLMKDTLSSKAPFIIAETGLSDMEDLYSDESDIGHYNGSDGEEEGRKSEFKTP